MATNVFSHAKKLRKSHPNMNWQALVKKAGRELKGGKKVGARPHKKAAARPAAKKVSIKISGTKKRRTSHAARPQHIGSISHHKIGTEQTHLRSLESVLSKHQAMLKGKGLTTSEKAAIRRDVEKTKNAIRASKAHIQALKKSL